MKAIVCLLFSVSVTPWILATDNGRASQQEDDIREAVFRYLLAQNRYTLPGDTFENYLALGFRKRTENVDPSDLLSGLLIDPSDAFMKRFLGMETVHKASSCREGSKGGVRDKQTGKLGLLLVVTKIMWVSDTEAQVEAEYHRAPLAAEGFTYVVKKERERWNVADSIRRWIS